MGYMTAIESALGKYEMANATRPYAIVASWETLQEITAETRGNGSSFLGDPWVPAGYMLGVEVWRLDAYPCGHVGLVDEATLYGMMARPGHFANVSLTEA